MCVLDSESVKGENKAEKEGTYKGVSGGFAPEGGEGLRKQAKKTFGEKDSKQRGAHTSKP